MTRVLLLRPATTAETRRATFPSTRGAAVVVGCPSLERGGVAAASSLRDALPPPDRVWTSHARRAHETAALALGPLAPGGQALTELAGCDVGRWAGRPLSEVLGAEPDDVAAWRSDPGFDGHGGESRSLLRARAAALLARCAAVEGTTLAVAHGDLIRAAVAEALDAPDAAFWSLEAPPASVTELSFGGGSWRVLRTAWSPALRGGAMDRGQRPAAETAGEAVLR